MSLPLNVGYEENKQGWRSAEVGMRWVGIRDDKQIVQLREGACQEWRGYNYWMDPL